MKDQIHPNGKSTTRPSIQAKRKPKKNSKVRIVTNGKGEKVEVIVPWAVWRDIQSELETAYLWRHEAMRKRLLESMKRKKGIPMTIEELRAAIIIDKRTLMDALRTVANNCSC